MKQNIGSVDRIVRLVLGIALIAFAITQQAWWALIGIIPLLTGIVSFCPLYTLFGMSTCPRK
ncbi:MAG: DUF2892 domain-containing protein [Methanoregulaceae archaeon]|nr:DUF2892 domain-containing protein [Methanoregulaceae archaeon]